MSDILSTATFCKKNLLNSFLVFLSTVFQSLSCNSRGPSDYDCDKAVHILRSLNFYALFHFNFCEAFFCIIFLSAGNVTSVNTRILSFFFPINISGLFARTSLSAPLNSLVLSYLHIHIQMKVHVNTNFLLFRSLISCISNDVNMSCYVLFFFSN
jgi:hypothetical protein